MTDETDTTILGAGEVKILNFGGLKRRSPGRAVVFIKGDGEYKQISDEDTSEFNEIWSLGFHSYVEINTNARTYPVGETVSTAEPPYAFTVAGDVTAYIANPRTFVRRKQTGPLKNAFMSTWFSRIRTELSKYGPDQLLEAQRLLDEEAESLENDPDIINGVRVQAFTLRLANDQEFVRREFGRVINRAFVEFGAHGLIALQAVYPAQAKFIDEHLARLSANDARISADNDKEWKAQFERIKRMMEVGMISEDEGRRLLGDIEQLPNYTRREQNRGPKPEVDPERLIAATRPQQKFITQSARLRDASEAEDD